MEYISRQTGTAWKAAHIGNSLRKKEDLAGREKNLVLKRLVQGYCTDHEKDSGTDRCSGRQILLISALVAQRPGYWSVRA